MNHIKTLTAAPITRPPHLRLPLPPQAVTAPDPIRVLVPLTNFPPLPHLQQHKVRLPRAVPTDLARGILIIREFYDGPRVRQAKAPGECGVELDVEFKTLLAPRVAPVLGWRGREEFTDLADVADFVLAGPAGDPVTVVSAHPPRDALPDGPGIYTISSALSCT